MCHILSKSIESIWHYYLREKIIFGVDVVDPPWFGAKPLLCFFNK